MIWSNRATALRTCCASVSGSLRCFGKAKTVSGKSLLHRQPPVLFVRFPRRFRHIFSRPFAKLSAKGPRHRTLMFGVWLITAEQTST